MSKKQRPLIMRVLVFHNGMVAVFDENGQQLPQYQGEWKDKQQAILNDSNPATIVEYQ